MDLRIGRLDQVRADLRSGERVTDMVGLLRVALEDAKDLDRCEYNPNSSVWHDGQDYTLCNVCLAGMVMAGTMGEDPTSDVMPATVTTHKNTKLALVSLDYLRSWCILSAATTLKIPLSEEQVMAIEELKPVGPTLFRNWFAFDDLSERLERLADELDVILGTSDSDVEIHIEERELVEAV